MTLEGPSGSLVQDSQGGSLTGVTRVSSYVSFARTFLPVPASVWCPYVLTLAPFRPESSPERPAELRALNGGLSGSVLEKLRSIEISASPPGLAEVLFSQRRGNTGPGSVPCGPSCPGSAAGSVGLRCRSARVVISDRLEQSAGGRLAGRSASALLSVATT